MLKQCLQGQDNFRRQQLQDVSNTVKCIQSDVTSCNQSIMDADTNVDKTLCDLNFNMLEKATHHVLILYVIFLTWIILLIPTHASQIIVNQSS